MLKKAPDIVLMISPTLPIEYYSYSINVIEGFWELLGPLSLIVSPDLWEIYFYGPGTNSDNFSFHRNTQLGHLLQLNFFIDRPQPMTDKPTYKSSFMEPKKKKSKNHIKIRKSYQWLSVS